MILQLSNGTYLHTAYAVSNIPEEFTAEDWSLTSQEGMHYIGTYIDSSSVESTDPTQYSWEELLDTAIDDTDSEGEMPVADYQAQIDALQDQVSILQTDKEDLAGNIEINANNVATASELGSTAQDLALEANQVAQATGQHFWSTKELTYFLSTDTTVDTSKTYYSYDGTDYTEVTPIGTEDPSTEGWYEALGTGAYVTAQTQDEFKQTPTGKNSLWNSLGMLFRSGLNYLLAILAGGADGTGPKGIAIYDGQGNTDNNMVAQFTDSGSVIGKDAKTIIGSNRIIMLNEEGVGLFEATGTGQSISQRVSEYYGIMLTHTMTLDYTIFTKGIPPQGTEFNIEYDYGGPTPKQPAFTVGVWKSYDFENPDINTIEIVYDGAQTISISYEKLMPYWGDAEIVGLSYTLTSDAPAFTLGNRALDNTKGAYSLAVGNSIIASENYQTVLGKYNVEEANTILIIGNGTDDNNRANILEVDTQGSITASGDIIAGKTLVVNNDSGTKVNITSNGAIRRNGSNIFAFATASGTSTLTTGHVTHTTSYTLPANYNRILAVRAIDTNHQSILQLTAFNVNGDGSYGATCSLVAHFYNRSSSNAGSTTVTWELCIGAF